MAKIITVHGTFAGDEADKGEKWWQQGSEFLDELQDYVEEPLEVEPFHWSGANSELDRRKAGAELYNKIKDEKEPPVIIGHSHGGSSGILALALAMLKKPKEAASMIRGFISVGTPMILFKGNRNPFTRFNIVGRLLLVWALSALSLSMMTTLGSFGPSDDREIAERLLQFLAFEPTINGGRDFGFWVAIGSLLLLFGFNSRTAKRRNLFSENKVFQALGDKYIALSHRRDEAINGLQKGRTVKPKVFTRQSMIVGIFSFLSFTVLFTEFLLDISSDTIFNFAKDNHYYEVVNEEQGTVLPRVYLTQDPFKAFRFPEIGADTKLYDQFGAQLYHTRNTMVAIPFSELWEADETRTLLETPEAAWLKEIRDSIPLGTGMVFVRTDEVNKFYKNFDDQLLIINAIGEEGYQVVLECAGAAEEDCGLDAPTIENWTYAKTVHGMIDAMTRGNLDTYLPEGSEISPPDGFLPDALVANLPNSDFIGLVDGNLLYADTHLYAGAWAAGSGKQICSGQSTNDSFHCTTLYAGRDSLYRSIYRYGDVKYLLPEYIPLINDISTGNYVFTARYVLTILVIIGAGIIAIILGFVVTPVLGQILTNSLRGKAYGNDGYGERIADVRASMDFNDTTVGTLPQSVQDEMIANSLEDAPVAIERLRKMLAGEGLGEGGVDPIAVATKFEKSELIHNAYFHSPLFIKHVAAILIEKFGFTPSAKFRSDDRAMTYRYTMD